MCLVVNMDVKAKKTNAEGFCVAWKVIRKVENRQWYKSAVSGETLPNYQYVLGENVSNRLSKKDPWEVNEINKGFHCFLYRSDARKLIKNIHTPKDAKVIQVFYKPEDVIAYGFRWGSSVDKCVAVMKLTVKDLSHCR